MKLFHQTYKTKTDEELMRAIQSGETKAFDVLYDRYSARLLNYFYRRLGQQENVAQDMLHDLFVKIIEKPFLFDANKSFSTWIYTVASNMCKNEYRRRDIRKIEQRLHDNDEHENIESESTPDELLEQKSFTEALFQKLDQLDDIKQNTFLLRFQHQLSIKEISEVMACSPGTVKSRLFYTIRALADALQDYNPNEVYI